MIELSAAPLEQVGSYRLRIIPPDFARHALEEVEGFDQSVQDRFGPFGRQGQSERTIGVSPRRHQHRHLAAPFREVDIDVTEVDFEALAGIVVERNVRLPIPVRALTEVAAHSFIPAAVAVFLLQPPPQLGCGMSLLPRCLLVGLQDAIDNRLERIKN
jgi:hypothetical protein